jgi:hypothetical protein
MRMLQITHSDLVVVRMREPSEGNTMAENDNYGFLQLPKLATKLVAVGLPAE